jgi:hypothetical protein
MTRTTFFISLLLCLITEHLKAVVGRSIPPAETLRNTAFCQHAVSMYFSKISHWMPIGSSNDQRLFSVRYELKVYVPIGPLYLIVCLQPINVGVP